MTDREKWYQYCQLCKYSYLKKDDPFTVLCSVSEYRCPHREEIETQSRGKKNDTGILYEG